MKESKSIKLPTLLEVELEHEKTFSHFYQMWDDLNRLQSELIKPSDLYRSELKIEQGLWSYEKTMAEDDDTLFELAVRTRIQILGKILSTILETFLKEKEAYLKEKNENKTNRS